jgi:hypothetical protein
MSQYPGSLTKSATRGIDTLVRYSPAAATAYKIASVSGAASTLPPIFGQNSILLGYGGFVIRQSDPSRFGAAALPLRVGRRMVAISIAETVGT